MKITYNIVHHGEPSAGISAYSDAVTIIVESGEPGGEENEFRDFMMKCLSDWYDGAKIDTDPRCPLVGCSCDRAEDQVGDLLCDGCFFEEDD